MRVASTTGQNGKHPCRFCEINGVYIGHYYFLSWLYKDSPSRRGRKEYYDSRQLPLRTTLAIEDTFLRLSCARNNTEREKISRDKGIKGRSLLFVLPSMRPYNCFPIYIMHLFYNVLGRLLELHLSDLSQEFSLSDTQIRTLDEELVVFQMVSLDKCLLKRAL